MKIDNKAAKTAQKARVKEAVASRQLSKKGVDATKPKRTKLDYPKADIDNYLKAIFDCLNGKLWVDDKQVVVVHAEKAWTEPGEEGYFVVRVEKLNS